MTVDEVVAWLRSRGKPNTARIYRRHGVAGETVGVAYADIGALVKRLRIDQALASDLWNTGLHDARVVAAKIADPAAMTRRRIEAWLQDCKDYVITGAVAGLAARMPVAAELAHGWIETPTEFHAAAGWNVFSIIATDGALPVAAARPLLRRIVRDIHAAPNRARYSMNNALIAVGGGIPELRETAIDAAREIGPVVVDHGETGCQTPDAASYIQRMANRAPRRARGAANRKSTQPASA